MSHAQYGILGGIASYTSPTIASGPHTVGAAGSVYKVTMLRLRIGCWVNHLNSEFAGCRLRLVLAQVGTARE
jgi:hypothetical protein